MTYRAIPTPTRRFGRTVRIIASIDLAIAVVLAVPFTASLVLDYVFRVDRLLGFDTPPVDPRPSLVFLLNLAGVMAAVWAIARLTTQTTRLARLDVWRRAVVAALIVYYVLLRDQTPVLLLFVLTELAVAIWQALATRRFVRATGE